MDEQDDVIVLRGHARRFVQSLFGLIALTFLTLALIAHHVPESLPLPEGDATAIGAAFLYLGAAYTLTMFMWEWLFRDNA